MSRVIGGLPRASRGRPSPRRRVAGSAAPLLCCLSAALAWSLAATLVAPGSGRLIGPLPPPTLAAQEPLTAMDRAAARYREVQAICADFEQVIEVRLLRRIVERPGRICQRRPNLFSMRFTDPEGDMVVSDGEYVWIYYPSRNREQVMRRPVADSPGGEDFFHEFLDAPGTKYEAEEGGVEAVDGRDCRVVTLTPLAGASYRRARLWLDLETHVIRRVELHELSENVRTVTLYNVDLASVPDPALFVFTVPEGARVMRR